MTEEVGRFFKYMNMHKITVTLLSIIFMVSGCGGVGTHQLVLTGEKDTSIRVIVNDQELKELWPCRFKYSGYCAEFVGKLEDALGRSYKNVSVHTGYNNPQQGELLVIPQKLDMSISDMKKGRMNGNATATIKVITNGNIQIYNVDGAFEHELSIPTTIVMFPIIAVTGFVGLFVGGAEAGVQAPFKLWRGGVASGALEALAADLHNKITRSIANSTPREKIKEYITEKILSEISNHVGWRRVVIVEFKIQNMAHVDLEGYLTKQLDDESSGQKRGLSVVSKSDANKVLAALKKDYSQLVKPISGNRFFINSKDIKKFGELSFADVLLMGTLTEQSGKIYLNAQFIDTDKTKISVLEDEAFIK